ncbi:hypothetical protein SDC9_42564 [bioreactor metagenome]|uniref:Integrase catalytic domain-containing protein n=1 Tax=bioreactor metagenome TaxID=1076179 RepID=A0A644VYJ6_9ZZZZ
MYKSRRAVSGKKHIIESFNATMVNELRNREIFDTQHEAKVLLARWVRNFLWAV